MGLCSFKRSLNLLTLLALAACQDDDCGIGEPCPANGPGVVATINVSLSSDSLLIDDQGQITAVARDSAGNIVPGAPFTFLSSDTTVVRVNSTGAILPVAPGDAVITVQSGSRKTDVTITILPRTFAILDAGGDFACGALGDGRGYCWGLGDAGQLAAAPDSACLDDLVPVARPCSVSPVRAAAGLALVQVSAGDSLACGVTRVGSVHCWGANTFGQLGDGTTASGGPTTVVTARRFTFVAAGSRHACGVSVDSTAFCWGEDSLGQLGDARRIDSPIPVPVVGGNRFHAITVGYRHSCAIATDMLAYCWGDNSQGQLGTGLIGGSIDIPARVAGGFAYVSISSSFNHTCAVTTGGAAHCWGADEYGQLGTGLVSGAVEQPVPVLGGISFAAVSAGRTATCGVATSGAAYCWGHNSYGELGNGSIGGNFSVPTAVAGGILFRTVSVGKRHACGIARDGTSYCGGSDVFGALGDGAQSAVAGVPVRVDLGP
ncbi:MAG: RCC1 domain-containing protein [Gemmatimonadaceae bacterium]